MSSFQQVRGADFKPVVNDAALQYHNDSVVACLVEHDGLTPDEARVLFKDTLKFLALTDSGVKLAPPAKIDLGWHNFILHTRDYADFCQQCFGHFIHHEPGSGLTYTGPKLDVEGTVAFAKKAYGELSSNWDNTRGLTCGSNGC